MSTPPSSAAPMSYKNTPNRSVSVRGVTFAYRRLGPDGGVPLILLNHLSAVLDHRDPRVVDGLAARRRGFPSRVWAAQGRPRRIHCAGRRRAATRPSTAQP